MAQGTKEKFLVLDLLQLDLRENDALDLKCIGGRPGLIREITVTHKHGYFSSAAGQAHPVGAGAVGQILRLVSLGLGIAFLAYGIGASLSYARVAASGTKQ